MKHNSKRKARRCATRPDGRLDWRRAAFLAMLVCPWAWGDTVPQNVLPTGFNRKSGEAEKQTTPGNSLTINQSSNRAVIEWSNFSIGQGKTVTFSVPNKSAITLNKVVAAPGTPPPRSEINGTLTSNGQVWLLNPSGVLIGPNGSINTSGFLASTHQLWDTSNTTGLADSAFLTAGNSFTLSNPEPGQIVNRGSIAATNGGYVILAGRDVRNENEGRISAMGGQVALGAGNTVNISFDTNKLLSFAVSGAPSTSGTVTNLGSLIADGGKIWLSARAAVGMTTAVINTSGTVQAKTASNVNGEIVLDGGNSQRVDVRGVVDVSGMNTGERGGAIKIYGNEINVAASTKIDARGDAGGGTITVGGDPSIPPAASVNIGTNAELNASAINRGNGGSVVVESDMTNPLSMTRVLGYLVATGGGSGGNGGTIATRGFGLDASSAQGMANTKVAGGTPGTWEFTAVGLGVGQAPSIGGGTPPPASITGAQIGNLLNDGTAVSITSMSGSNNGNLIPGNLNVWEKIEKTTGPRDVVLHLNAVNDVVINAGIEHKGGGKLGINLRADSDGNGAGGVTVANGQYLRSGGGDIKLGGGLNPENDYARNIRISGEINADGGKVTIRGSGPASGGPGVIVGSTAEIQGAEISINGQGQSAPSSGSAPMPEGVKIEGGAQITGANISIDATGVTIGEARIGAGSNLTVQAQGGDVLIGNLVDPANLRPAELGARLTISNANSIKGFVKDGITIGGLAATGNIRFATRTGNLTLAGDVKTDDATPNAITLIAGQNASAGTTSDGNIIMQGAPVIKTGAGGRVRLYTGSIDGSTGLVDFAGAGSGNFRYNSTVQSTGFTAPLASSGNFVIYRERPMLGLAAPGGSITYGDLLPAVQYTGLVNGDTPTLAVPTAPNVSVDGTKSSSGHPTVGDHSTSVSPRGDNALGYGFNYTPATLTVTKRDLSIRGITASDKTYDGNAATTVSTTGVARNGLVAGDEVLVSASGNFTDKNVARDANGRPIAKAVNLASTYSGADAGNYAITDQTTANAVISPKALSVSGITARDKTYDGNAAAAVSTTGVARNGLVAGDEVLVSASGNFTDKNVARDANGRPIAKAVNLASTYSGADAGNYAITGQTTTAAVIAPAALSVSGITARDKTYDGTTKAELDIAAAQLTGRIANDELILRDSANFTDKDVQRDVAGNPIAQQVTLANNLTGRDAKNYQISLSTPISAIIRPRVLSIGLVGNPTKQVDGNDTAFLLAENFSIQGLINGEQLTVAPTTGRYESALPGTGIAVETQVPSDKMQAGAGTRVSNYALPVAPVTGTGTIKPLPERKVSAELPKGNTPLMPSLPAPAPAPPAAAQTPPGTENGASNSPAARQSADDKRQEKPAADAAPERAASNDKPKDEPAPTQTTATEKTDTPTIDAPAERTAANDQATDKPKDERGATPPGASPDKPAATTTATAPAPLVAKAERVSTLSVAAPPPSPVPQEKPPTPRDTADGADRTLAAASTPAAPKPAPQARRQAARKVEVGPGLVAVQPATRAASTAGAARDSRISMNGNTGKW